VRVRLESSWGGVATTALANSGYEAEEPEVVIPTRVAERFGLYPELPTGSEVREYGVWGRDSEHLLDQEASQSERFSWLEGSRPGGGEHRHHAW